MSPTRTAARPATASGAPPQLVDRLEVEVGALVRRIRRVILERARAVHEDLQVTAYLVLSMLADAGPQRAATVVEELGIDKGAISRHVQQLVELGFVARTPDPEDGRAAILSVTAEGRRRLTRTARDRRRMLNERLATWSEAELTTFVDALGRYNRTLDA